MSPEDIISRVQGYGLVSIPVYYNTYEATRDVLDRGIDGDFVECGVFAGAQVGVMALAASDHPDLHDRRFHLFDSFQGIPMAGPKDDAQPGIGALLAPGTGELVTSGVSVCSRQQVEENLRSWGVSGARLDWHEGWFQDTVRDWPKDRRIALLRLDGDLYASTLVCLRHLYPALEPGGICIVDDCALTGCALAVSDYFKGDPPPRTPVTYGAGCEWWVKTGKEKTL